MNYASSETLLPLAVAPLAENRHPLERSLLDRIETLKSRLDNFTVVDGQGETVGEIRNLVLYKRRLHLVIVQPDAHRHWRFVLLSSPLVQRVSPRDRTVLVHTTHTDLSYLPEQQSTTTRVSLKQHGSAHASVVSPVNQLPALVLTDRAHDRETAEPLMVLLEPIALKAQGKVKVPLVMESAAMPKIVAAMVDGSVTRSPSVGQENTDTHPAHAYPVVTPAQPAVVRVQ